MNMLSRLRSDILIKILIGIVLAIVVSMIPNYQKWIYRRVQPLTENEVKTRTVQKSIGYLPADDIPDAKSVEDIQKSSYCTFTVKGSELHATGYYRILDESKAGVKKGTGRKAPDQKHAKFSQKCASVTVMNNMGPQYGQFYVAELESGEQVIVLLDKTVLSLNQSRSIRLPIGRVARTYPVEYFEEIASKYDLKENGNWYIDMAGSNFVNSGEAKFLGVIRFLAGLSVFVLSYLLLSLLLPRTSR